MRQFKVKETLIRFRQPPAGGGPRFWTAWCRSESISLSRLHRRDGLSPPQNPSIQHATNCEWMTGLSGQITATDQYHLAKVLGSSSSTGHQLRFHTDRGFLVRAIQLGFREIGLKSPIGPAFCQDDLRNYFWALLTEEQGLPPVLGSTRIGAPDVA